MEIHPDTHSAHSRRLASHGNDQPPASSASQADELSRLEGEGGIVRDQEAVTTEWDTFGAQADLVASGLPRRPALSNRSE